MQEDAGHKDNINSDSSQWQQQWHTTLNPNENTVYFTPLTPHLHIVYNGRERDYPKLVTFFLITDRWTVYLP